MDEPKEIESALSGGVPAGQWKEGLLFKGIGPTPSLRSASNWFPRTETLGHDEMQIIFMGTAPGIRSGQMNTSIFVRLGNGDSFIFDIGEGAVANYVKVTEDRRLDTWYLLLDTDYRSCTIH